MWEYHSVTDSLPGPNWTELQALGEAGWELCATIPFGTSVRLIFKRPPEEALNASTRKDRWP